MIDSEKVKDGLYRCTCPVPGSCRGCPYNESNLMECFPQCAINLCKDALELLSELLKEQEPVKPKIHNGDNATSVTLWYVCGECECAISPGDNYCGCCGRPVKWDVD